MPRANLCTRTRGRDALIRCVTPSAPPLLIPAIVTAGDQRAARAVYGESKVYLRLADRALVAHVVGALQCVPEIGEVWVVGNADRLRSVFADPAVAAGLSKPLHIVPQFRSLYENGWQTYRRLLPGAPAEGRDPGADDRDLEVLYLSGDLPLAMPAEISEFIRRSRAADCCYALGLTTEDSMRGFLPVSPGAPGIAPAFFNVREGRFRQSNLHLIRPARILNRHYLEEMYEHRYQKEWGNIAGLAWRLLRSQQGGLAVAGYYLLMVLAGFAHRRRWYGLADWIRARIPIPRVERGIGSLLGASFRLIVTEAGGAAFDVDSEEEYDALRARFEIWWKEQRARAETLYGRPAFATGSPSASAAAEPRA
jgi:hypothetical protein